MWFLQIKTKSIYRKVKYYKLNVILKVNCINLICMVQIFNIVEVLKQTSQNLKKTFIPEFHST